MTQKTDATQDKDVSIDGEEKTTPINARAAALEEIASRNNETRKQEQINAGFTAEEDPEIKPETTEDSPVALIEEEQAAAAAAAAEEKAKTGKKYILKVDGEEEEADEEKVIEHGIRALQKDRSADRKMEEAATLKKEARDEADRILREARDEADRILQESRQNGATANAATQTAGADTTTESKADAEAIADAILYGDKDQAVDAIGKILNQSKPAAERTATQYEGMSKEEVARLINEQVAINSAMDWFTSEAGYKDLWDDPNTRKLVLQKDEELVKNGDTRSYRERFAAVGEEVRAWKKSLVPESTGFEDVDKDKQKIDPIRSSGSKGPAAVVRAQTEEEKRAETLNGIRKSRHQI